MTQHLIVLGDSLADSGNTASVLQLIGQNPFEDDIYDKGGNVKASDGPVLGEFVAIEMGAKIDDAQLISAISSEGPKDVQVHNYAHSGASTDASPGFSLPTGEFVGMGLKEQKKRVVDRKLFYKSQTDVDVLISAGGNDIRDAAVDAIDQIKEVIATDSKKDDRQFARSIAKPIARNLRRTIRRLAPFTDEIAFGVGQIFTETPEAQDWLTNFSSEDQRKALGVINIVGKRLRKKMVKKYRDIDHVAVIDAAEVWSQLDSPSFVDKFHPDAKTSSEFAKIFVNEASDQLTSFGF